MNVTSASTASQVYQTNKTTATKATSAYDSVASSAEPVDKMDEMKEKYKDVYTPIPETYSKADEDLQTQKIYEAYPSYISGPAFLELVSGFYDGEAIELGQTPTQEQKDKQEIAFDKAYELFGGQEAFTKMQRDVFEIKDKYPVNPWGADERNHNETELARFHNAVVYESLESGKSVKESKRDAINMINSFMVSGITETNLIDTLIKAGRIDSIQIETDPNEYKVNFDESTNSTWDLREYGIEGSWREHNIYENANAMISELEKKVGQFNFMLNNEDLIEKANSKLNGDYQTLGQADHYKEYIMDEYLPETQKALDIFKNYKIYDSINIKV